MLMHHRTNIFFFVPDPNYNPNPTHQPHSRKNLFQSEEIKHAERARQEKPIPWSEKAKETRG
jgi:hypothetical protein